jgi:hypothetical protein
MMAIDRSLRVLREASPRRQPGFDQWTERFDPLKEQIPAAPGPARHRLPGNARRRRLIGLSAAAAAVSAAATVAGVLLSAAAPQPAYASAYLAARHAVAVTAEEGSGTMTTTVAHDGVIDTLDTTRWNGHDIATSSGPRHQLGPYRQLLLIGGGAYVQQASGTWLRFPSESDTGPKLGPAVRLAEDNVKGNAVGQILALATGLQQAKQPDGTTVYTGTIPDSSTDTGVNPADDAISGIITSLRSGNEPGAPGGSHADLQLRLVAGSGGLVQQISLTFQQHDSGSSAGDGAYTWRVTYSQLGSTPPIAIPATSTPA